MRCLYVILRVIIINIIYRYAIPERVFNGDALFFLTAKMHFGQ